MTAILCKVSQANGPSHFAEKVTPSSHEIGETTQPQTLIDHNPSVHFERCGSVHMMAVKSTNMFAFTMTNESSDHGYR